MAKGLALQPRYIGIWGVSSLTARLTISGSRPIGARRGSVPGVVFVTYTTGIVRVESGVPGSYPRPTVQPLRACLLPH
jgi:hypothetical protein